MLLHRDAWKDLKAGNNHPAFRLSLPQQAAVTATLGAAPSLFNE